MPIVKVYNTSKVISRGNNAFKVKVTNSKVANSKICVASSLTSFSILRVISFIKSISLYAIVSLNITKFAIVLVYALRDVRFT